MVSTFHQLGRRLAFCSLFVAPMAGADEFIAGHRMPLPSERLSQAAQLKCGLTITEWRGSRPNFERVARLCDLATNRYQAFILRHGAYALKNIPFRFKAAFMPGNNEYRSLNDRRYRFEGRVQSNALTGYTVIEDEYIYATSRVSRWDFDVNVVHELFHAQSIFFGAMDQHPGRNRDERLNRDEELAVKFTRELGLGE